MTIEKLCEMLGIKGLITYTESDKYLSVRKDGILYIYNKETGKLLETK